MYMVIKACIAIYLSAGNASQPHDIVQLPLDHVIGISVGFSLIVLFIAAVILTVVIISYKTRRMNYRHNSKSTDMGVPSSIHCPRTLSTYSITIYDENMADSNIKLSSGLDSQHVNV